MKRFAFAIGALLLISSWYLSCASPSPAAHATVTASTVLAMPSSASVLSPPAQAQAGSSVWKVNRDGNTLFLGGSVHILRETDFPLPAEYERAFAQSAVLVLEVDIEQMADPALAQYYMNQMRLPGNQTLRSVLDRETYVKLEAAFNEYETPINTVSNYKPSMAMNVLTLLQIRKLGFVQQGVDIYYLEKARLENKPVKFLETVQAQINMLATIGSGYENDFVRYSLLDMENTETELDTFLAGWRSGNSLYSEALLADMRDRWPEIYQALVTARHSTWLPQIKEFLASRTVHFVIAGFLHMHGPDGILRQLKEDGYNIEQLR